MTGMPWLIQDKTDKSNPGKFRQKRTCCGPGWPTVHRVKEHLYRCHTIGKHTCSRCLQKCKSASELLAHQRTSVPCETKTDAFPEGTMMPSQEEALRIKKRVPPNTTEEQRWNEVYLILFPEETGALPSPCKFVPTPSWPRALVCGIRLEKQPVISILTCAVQSTRTSRLRHACPRVPSNWKHPSLGFAAPPSMKDI